MKTYQDKLEELTDNEVYKQVLRDSFGGVLYNVANQGKYDSTEVLELWDNMTPQEQGAVNGIIKGAINFLQGN